MNRLERDRLLRRMKSASDAATAAGIDRGKGKAQTTQQQVELEQSTKTDADDDADQEDEERKKVLIRPLVLFACRHIWHKDCLERAMEQRDLQHEERREFRCPGEHADGEK